ncbi:putative Mcak-like kinesin [Leptomonas pyrrhocoris]|uniref:Kinesin-like protein n=1 Tax=Leptomonas pyrrhocoris TaxID=157538 RepID=A0A0M9FV06_LEPPY|nr:putative Mcak-like kinesin [Leptomonas pyrrhocoris]KPA76563.1 putative Mcak-like kinesin [Leptomonas pyrrhocoris]|eukprot:XP_015655002.1 putative Mcak-like kinesin [Leptomonas pyrrhocoris]
MSRDESTSASVEGQRPSPERSTSVAPSVSPTMNSTITVAVRKRCRIAGREDDENDVVRCDDGGGPNVTVYARRTKLDLTPVIEPSSFSYDHVFGEWCTNDEVYKSCCQPLLQSVREGGGAVIFAFGQTGSGKTYTMLGNGDTPGLYSLAVTELLAMTQGSMTASFYEVYGVKLYDLLNDRAEVKMLQDEYQNVHIVGITEQPVRSVDDVNALMTSGQQLRAIGTTHANDRSSRSHAVLEIKLTVTDGGDGQQQGRITFVDLAGSERASDTAETDARTRREGAEINKSLLALKECIRAMSMRKRHIPFRGSKLTQILRESFVGRCKTCVIATISPCQSHCEDTLNSLRYADRIKELKGPANPNNGVKPIPCKMCGQPIFIGDRHVCKRQLVLCPHCRQDFDKQELETHMAECKDAPMRCPHCNERMLRGDLSSHFRRCTRVPTRCAACGAIVPRQLMEKHTSQECAEAKVKCRYCGSWQSRQTVAAHEQNCDAMKVTCPYCLQFFRKRRLHAHVVTCLRNPNLQLSSPGRVSPGCGSGGAGGGAGGGSEFFMLADAASDAAASSLSNCTPQRSPRDPSPRSSPSRASSMHYFQKEEDIDAMLEAVGEDVGTTQKYTRAHSLNNSTTQLQSSASFVDRPSSQRAPAAGRRWNAASVDGIPSPTAAEEEDGGVVCPYSRYGCPVKVTRLNLAAHLMEWMQRHLELVTSYADRVDEQNMQLRRLVVNETDTLSSWASKRNKSPRP